MVQGVFNVGPLGPVKCLFKINFEGHVTGLSFLFLKVRNDFILYNGMATSPPIGHEASLTLPNDARKQTFVSIGNNLGDDFVDSVAESNGSEDFQIMDIWSLGYQT